MTVRASVFSIAVTILFAATAARAQPPGDTEARARARFEAGQRLVEQGRFAEAYVEFERGYELSKKPLFLFNMGECARSMGDPERARDAYERYLREDPNGRLAATARERLAELPPARATPPPRKRRPPPGGSAPAADGATARPDLITPPPPDDRRRATSRSLLGRWETWAGVGAALVLGSVVVYATTRDGDDACGGGCVDLRP